MDVGLERPLPFLVADITDLLERVLMRRVVDEDVYCAERLDGALDDRATMIGIADVAGDQDDLASLALHQRLDLSGILVLVQIGDDDVGTFPGIGDRDRAADATVATGDDCLLSGQSPGGLGTLLAVIRSWIHRAGRTGHRLLLGRIRRLWIFGHGVAPGIYSANGKLSEAFLAVPSRLVAKPHDDVARQQLWRVGGAQSP